MPVPVSDLMPRNYTRIKKLKAESMHLKFFRYKERSCRMHMAHYTYLHTRNTSFLFPANEYAICINTGLSVLTSKLKRLDLFSTNENAPFFLVLLIRGSFSENSFKRDIPNG